MYVNLLLLVRYSLSFLLVISFLTSKAQTQLGQTLYQEYPQESDLFGTTNALSAEGNRLVVGDPWNGEYTGSVRYYELQTNSWVQMGADIDGVNNNCYSSSGLDISGNGSTIIIGDHGCEPQAIRVYKIDQNQILIKTDTMYFSENERFGQVAKLSYDGNTFAVGTQQGSVRVFYFDGKNWNQKGQDMKLNCNDLSFYMDMDDSGNVIFLGCSFEEENVVVYHYINDKWAIKGSKFLVSDLLTTATTGNLSGAGNRLVLTQNQYVKIFDFIDSDWLQIGSSINGPFGPSTSVYKNAAINYSGNRIAVHRNISSDNRVWVLDYNEGINDWIISYDIPVGFVRHLSFNSKGNVLSVSDGGNFGPSKVGKVIVYNLDCPEDCSTYNYVENYFFCSNDQIVLSDGTVLNDTISLTESLVSVDGCDSLITSIFNHFPSDTTILRYQGCISKLLESPFASHIVNLPNNKGAEFLQEIIDSHRSNTGNKLRPNKLIYKLDDLDEDAIDIYYLLKGSNNNYTKLRTNGEVLSQLSSVKKKPALLSALDEAGFGNLNDPDGILKNMIDRFTSNHDKPYLWGCSFCGGNKPHIEEVLVNLNLFATKDINNEGAQTVISLLNSGKLKAKGTNWVMAFSNSKNYPNATFEELVSEGNGNFSVDVRSGPPLNINHECKSWKKSSGGLMKTSNLCTQIENYASTSNLKVENVQVNFDIEGFSPSAGELKQAFLHPPNLAKWNIELYGEEYKSFFDIDDNVFVAFNGEEAKLIDYIVSNHFTDLIQ